MTDFANALYGGTPAVDPSQSFLPAGTDPLQPPAPTGADKPLEDQLFGSPAENIARNYAQGMADDGYIDSTTAAEVQAQLVIELDRFPRGAGLQLDRILDLTRQRVDTSTPAGVREVREANARINKAMAEEFGAANVRHVAQLANSYLLSNMPLLASQMKQSRAGMDEAFTIKVAQLALRAAKGQ